MKLTLECLAKPNIYLIKDFYSHHGHFVYFQEPHKLSAPFNYGNKDPFNGQNSWQGLMPKVECYILMSH